MMLRIIFTGLVCLFSFSMLQAQNRVPVIGKLIARGDRPQGVTVTNLAIRQTLSIHSTGSFNVLGQAGDTLYFRNIFSEEYKHVLTKDDMDRELLYVPFESKYAGQNQGQLLNEIKITKLDLKAMGLDFPDAPKRTPVERMLYTASGSSPIDALINMFSGRTAMLKKALAYEKTEIASNKLLDIFSDEELSRQFNVELDQVKGFTYFLMEDNEIKELLDQEKPNRRKIEFRISELIVKFKKQIEGEKNEIAK